MKMFKVFFEIFNSIWGFDSDWLDKQAFAPIFQFQVLLRSFFFLKRVDL